MLYIYEHELNIEFNILVQLLQNFVDDRLSINRILSSTVRDIFISFNHFNTTSKLSIGYLIIRDSY